MFTLLDRARQSRAKALLTAAFGRRSSYTRISVQPVLNASPKKEIWLCFPGFLSITINLTLAWGLHNFLPKSGRVYVINGPLSIAGFTPYESIDAITRLEVVVQDLISHNQGYDINIFSVSAGTYPGFYFANKLHAKRLIAVAPGPRMGLGIFTSPYSSYLSKKCIEAGFSCTEYDRIITKYNQENNIDNLPTESNLLIFGAQSDYVIKNYGTKEIVRLCRAAGKNPKFRNFPLLDHISLGMWLGFLNKMGFDPYGLRN